MNEPQRTTIIKQYAELKTHPHMTLVQLHDATKPALDIHPFRWLISKLRK